MIRGLTVGTLILFLAITPELFRFYHGLGGDRFGMAVTLWVLGMAGLVGMMHQAWSVR